MLGISYKEQNRRICMATGQYTRRILLLPSIAMQVVTVQCNRLSKIILYGTVDGSVTEEDHVNHGATT